MVLRNLYPIHLILNLVLVSIVNCSVHAAHHGNVDPTGTWKMTINAPDGQTYYPEAKISKDGDNLKGSYYSPSLGQTLELKEASIESGNKLQFTIGNQGLKIKYVGKIESNHMSGTAHIDYQGQQYDADFSAARVAKTAIVSGTWNFSVVSEDGQNSNPVLTIAEEEGALSGIFKNRSAGREITPSKLELNGNELLLKLEGKWGFASYEGTIDGEKIVGTVEGEFQGSAVKGTFTGKLEK